VRCTFLWYLVHIKCDLYWSSYYVFSMMTDGDVCLQLWIEMYSVLKCIQYWNVFSTEMYSALKCIQYWNVFSIEMYSVLKCIQYWNVFSTEMYSVLKCNQYWNVFSIEIVMLYYLLNETCSVFEVAIAVLLYEIAFK